MKVQETNKTREVKGGERGQYGKRLCECSTTNLRFSQDRSFIDADSVNLAAWKVLHCDKHLLERKRGGTIRCKVSVNLTPNVNFEQL